MKAIIFLLAAASAVLAQDMDGQPECAVECINNAITGAGCQGDDMACQCGPSQVVIVASAAPCLIENCSGLDLLSAQSAGAAACSSFSETATMTDAPDATTTTDEENQDESTTEMVSTTMTDDAGNTVTTEVPETETSTNVAAAATPVLLGAGAVMGVLGVVAAL